MKNFLLLICVAFSINLGAQVTRDEAINIVYDELIYPYPLEQKWLFSKYDIMYLNDTLWLEGLMIYYTCPYDENWVFFIDDLPIANWVHPCRYIFMDANTGEYMIIEEEWPPIPFLTNIEEFFLEWEWIQSTEVNQYKFNQQKEVLIINSNPFKNNLEIRIQSNLKETIHFQLFDSNGRNVMSVIENKPSKNERLVKLNTENLESGVYFLIVSTKNKLLVSKKLIKTD